MVAAPGTGEGKTLVGLGLAALAVRRARRVQPFKVGPDYIDARLYEAACGRPARNVDLWLDGAQRVRANVEGALQNADCAVFEGMMGLFDGDESGQTSSAHVAVLLDVPVVLVIDLWRCSQTAAAVALGCAQMQPQVRLAGVILNRTAGGSHERAVRAAFAQVGIAVLASLPYRQSWTIPERHLGLAAQRPAHAAGIIAEVADVLGSQLGLEKLLGSPPATHPSEPPRRTPRERVRIAVARDDAFWFLYCETLEALERAGAELVYVSPLDDEGLPPGVRGLWLCGGYPESFAARLARNARMRAAVAKCVADGLPVYAECGGMMYLAQELETADGVYPMAGALRGRTSIAAARLHIGYREAVAARDSILDRRGTPIRAYEFHYASGSLDEPAAYTCGDATQGAWRENVVASFLHRRFLPGDAAVARFVARCAAC